MLYYYYYTTITTTTADTTTTILLILYYYYNSYYYYTTTTADANTILLQHTVYIYISLYHSVFYPERLTRLLSTQTAESATHSGSQLVRSSQGVLLRDTSTL